MPAGAQQVCVTSKIAQEGTRAIVKLKASNYYAWSKVLKAELIEKNGWNAVDPGFDAEDVDDLNVDQPKLKRKALATLFKNVYVCLRVKHGVYWRISILPARYRI